MGGGVKMNSCDNAFAQVCTPSQPKMRLCSELTTRSETHINWASARVNCHHLNTSDSDRINFSCSSRLFFYISDRLSSKWMKKCQRKPTGTSETLVEVRQRNFQWRQSACWLSRHIGSATGRGGLSIPPRSNATHIQMRFARAGGKNYVCE